MMELVKPGMSSARIEIHLDTQEPIELVDLALSFQALALEYKKHLTGYLNRKNLRADDADVKLYITKIESGSVLAELASSSAILGLYFSVMDHTNIFVDFVKNIKDSIDYLKLLVNKENISHDDIRFTKAECQRLSDLLDVASKSKEGNYEISAIEYSSADEKIKKKVHLKVSYTSEEAYNAKRGALLAQKLLEHRGDADYKKVSMHFYQTNIDDPKASGRTADKAIIRTISDKPLPVYFVSDLDQQKIRYILDDPNENPFRVSLVVDVNVETNRHDEPVFYRIMGVDEIITDDHNVS